MNNDNDINSRVYGGLDAMIRDNSRRELRFARAFNSGPRRRVFYTFKRFLRNGVRVSCRLPARVSVALISR